MANSEYADTVAFFFGWYKSFHGGAPCCVKYIKDKGIVIGPVMENELIGDQQHSISETEFLTMTLATCETTWPFKT